MVYYSNHLRDAYIGEYKKYTEYIYSFTFLYAHGWRSIIGTEEKEKKREKKQTVRMKEGEKKKRKMCFKVCAQPIETLWPM